MQMMNNYKAQELLKEKIPVAQGTHELRINSTKTEEYEIPKPIPPPPLPPTVDTMITHNNDKICYSELDWLVHYTPPPVEDKTPDWRKCKLLGSVLDTETAIKRKKDPHINWIKKIRIHLQIQIHRKS